MGYQPMQVVHTFPNGKDKVFAYEFDVSLDNIGNSDWIIIPEDVNIITVALSFSGGGKGKVQHTIDTIDIVKNGVPIAIDWSLGEVEVSTSDIAFPVTAIRLVQTFVGVAKMTVRAQ